MPTTIEVRFKGNRKDYFLWPEEADRLHLHQPVIVEADRGLDFGRVGVVGDTADKKCASGCSGCAVGGDLPTASRPVIRIASQEDIKAANDLRRSEDTTRIKGVGSPGHAATSSTGSKPSSGSTRTCGCLTTPWLKFGYALLLAECSLYAQSDP